MRRPKISRVHEREHRIPDHAELSGKPALRANHSELDRTIVTAHLEEEHATGRNLLWCATFQLAWNELCDLVGDPVRLSPEPPMVGALNARAASREDLDPASYVARAGFGRDGILEQIHKDLLATFGEAAVPELLPASVPSEDLLAYAYLFKNLAFATPFGRADDRIRFRRTPVVGFGAWNDMEFSHWRTLTEQVTIRHHTGPDDFVVELATSEPEDRLLVARLRPARTLRETVKAALTRRTPEGGSQLQRDEELLVPSLDFEVFREYGEIEGASLRNPGFEHGVVAALQDIRFRLDEKGALLKSEAATYLVLGFEGDGPRRFVCDGPFLVLMVRTGRDTPYFALWVDNTELLLPATPGGQLKLD